MTDTESGRLVHEGRATAPSGQGLKERAEMRTFITRFLRDEDGQDLVEYVLLISLIALAVAASVPLVSGAIERVFHHVTDQFP